MSLIIALLLLAGWGIYGLIQALIPPAPVVKDWDKFRKDMIGKSEREVRQMLRSGKY